ncbi:hypothetical protein AVEN_21818-1 [Araneus ventricosus]|uniref:Uncharacterized protein n=1 Tax=Araneus ventricosus TaxID=182803 RepID=A0A4Y2PT10_ARAVE|nr:hypothetical protein AVEN_21818-1 [Araneus ventricosus]
MESGGGQATLDGIFKMPISYYMKKEMSTGLGTLLFLVNLSSVVTTANVGKRKALSIGAEKHGVNAFSQNEIEHFECCDDDVIASGEVSEADIEALINEKNNSIVDSSSDMEEEQGEHSIADANVLEQIFATENNDKHVVDLFKIVNKKFHELYIKSKSFQPKITSFLNVVD